MVEFEIDDRVEIDFIMTRFNIEFLMIGLNVGFLITRLKLKILDDKVKFFGVFIFIGLTPILYNGRVGLLWGFSLGKFMQKHYAMIWN
jgi:hypothetical protein